MDLMGLPLILMTTPPAILYDTWRRLLHLIRAPRIMDTVST